MPNAIPKIFSQKSNTRRYAGRPVIRCSASSTVSHAASPIVKDGKMMWNDTVKANCSRDSKSAVRSIGKSPRLAPQIRSREVDQLVAPAAHHGLHHVEREPLRHLDVDRGRHRELGAVHDRVDQDRAIVSKSSGYLVIDFSRVFDPDPADAGGFGPRR